MGFVDGADEEGGVDDEASTTETSGNQSHPRSETYHLKSNDPLGPANFYALRLEDTREGDIVRIWKENNDVMHLKTVVVIRAKGNLLAVCKINRCIPRSSDHHFKHHNAQVKILQHPETSKTDNGNDGTASYAQKTGNISANLPPVEVIMDEKQGMEDNCWLNLERSFDMGVEDNYKVVFCGKLEAASRKMAKEKYRQFMNDED